MGDTAFGLEDSVAVNWVKEVLACFRRGQAPGCRMARRPQPRKE